MAEKNYEKYICYDEPLPIPEQIKNLSDEENEDEFNKRFSDVLNKE